MSVKPVTPANQVFLVMGLEKNSDAAQNGYVIFAGVIAKDQSAAGALFLKNNPNFELMSVSALSEMLDAVELLTFIQEERDLQPSSTEFPIPVYREKNQDVDVGAFGL